MTKKTGHPPSQPRVRPKTRGGEVGYGKPPKEHRWRPGQSGNPRGRPRGSKNESTILRETLHRKIGIRVEGKLKKITVLEAIYLRIAEDSLKGNTKSAAFMLNRYGALVSGELQATDLSPDDREVLEDFAKRFESLGKKIKVTS